jgi:hypothetical protein
MAQSIDMSEKQLSEYETQYAYGPMVLEAEDGEGGLGHRRAYSVSVETTPDGMFVVLGGVEGSGMYALKSPDDLDVEADASKITFKSQGTIYTIRKFQDSDGTWASMTGAAVPAEALEEIYMNELAAEVAPDSAINYQEEELYALSDNDGKIAYLVYSGANVTYIRKGGKWEVLDDPNGDVLDDMFIDYVSPEFVDVFDKKESKGLTTADLVDYETEETVTVTASAATSFKFARVINKKD